MTGTYVTRTWTPVAPDGLPRRYLRSGPYRAYVPDPVPRDWTPAPDLAKRIERAQQAARAAREATAAARVGQVGDLLVRSEASASSRIEGYTAGAKAVAVAEFAGRGKPDVLTVARNLRAVRGVVGDSDLSTLVERVVEAQPALCPTSPGIRTAPVWIGGATPLDAHFVAPPVELVRDLLDDLQDAIVASAHEPVVLAALAHAQFESIHPFGDGNGRAGRILLAAILAGTGLTGDGALPVSTGLFADRERYYRALDASRTHGPELIVEVVADAVLAAASQASALAEAVDEWRAGSRAALDAHLRDRSPSGLVRTGTAHRLLDHLAAEPVLDTARVRAWGGVTDNAARGALETLAEAGVLHRDRRSDRTRTLYIARGLLELVGAAEGLRPAADPPDEPDRDADGPGGGPIAPLDAAPEPQPTTCGHWLPRAGRRCALPPGHAGQHR
jgi:hypothetical protein